MKNGKGIFCLCLIPSTKKLNTKSSDQEYSLVDKSTVEEITGYRLGMVSPFGLPEKIKVTLDVSALSHKEIGVGSGENGKEIIVSAQSLIRLTNAEVKSLAF